MTTTQKFHTDQRVETISQHADERDAGRIVNLDAAWQAGHDAYTKGEPRESCTLTEPSERAAWDRGWLRAFKKVALY